MPRSMARAPTGVNDRQWNKREPTGESFAGLESFSTPPLDAPVGAHALDVGADPLIEPENLFLVYAECGTTYGRPHLHVGLTAAKPRTSGTPPGPISSTRSSRSPAATTMLSRSESGTCQAPTRARTPAGHQAS